MAPPCHAQHVPFILRPDAIGLFKLTVSSRDDYYTYHAFYTPLEGPRLEIGFFGYICGGAGGAAPVIIDMDE